MPRPRAVGAGTGRAANIDTPHRPPPEIRQPEADSPGRPTLAGGGPLLGSYAGQQGNLPAGLPESADPAGRARAHEAGLYVRGQSRPDLRPQPPAGEVDTWALPGPRDLAHPRAQAEPEAS